jgi:UDP-4-amino-4,6-dideoxy-N-acetyl-beta-L-altrosamine transaminase
MTISYGRQTIEVDDVSSIAKALTSEYLTTGPKVAEFEQKFANYVGSKYAVAVSSGTAALHVACLAAGLKENDELITTPMTFAASANCALYCGARPVFVDIHEENGLIDEDKIEKKITKQTKIIIPVHYSGLPCEMEKIRKIAKKHRLIIIEDACHALGAKYKKSRIGNCKYSDLTVFSFHPVKHITTGEGGMITTNSKELYEKLKVFRNHGIERDPTKLVKRNEGPWYYEMQELGFNYRITDFQCALGLSQLKKLDGFINKRREIAKRYNDAFGNQQGLEIIREEEEQFNSYHLYIIKTESRKNRLLLFERLKEKGILCQVHYIPVYWHPYYQKLGYKKGACPNAENFYNQIISLPMYPTLNRKEQEFVIKTIKKLIKEAEESK